MKWIVALLAVSASTCLAASPNPATFSNPSPIVINDSASPPTPTALYPSPITVSNLSGVVSKVSVQFNNLSHGSPGDIDMLLVAPGGQKAVIFSDAGGTNSVTNLTITLDDGAPTFLSATGPLVSGLFHPTNYPPADSFPGNTTTSSNMLATFKGANPNGTWNLYVVDDTAGNAGTIAGGWSLTITTAASVTNSGFITINDADIATPYPSTITLSNLVGKVNKVTVRLLGLAHDFPNDIDILLVGPQGQNVVLWGEAGGPSPITGVNVTLDDSATQLVPEDSSVSSGAYKPTTYNTNLFWPSLPTDVVVNQTFTPSLSVFNGSDPNGDWKLYVEDDSAGADGNIAGGWALTVAVVASPTLNLQVSGTNAILSWPATVLGATLQSSPDLSSNSWTTVTPTPVYAAGQNVVTNVLGAGNMFYRLVK